MKQWLNLFEQPYNPDAYSPEEDEEEVVDPQDELTRQLEIKVKAFCEQEIGWDMDEGYAVIFEPSENLLTITPSEDEYTLEQLNKLSVLGHVTVNASSKQWSLTISVKTHPGLSIS